MHGLMRSRERGFRAASWIDACELDFVSCLSKSDEKLRRTLLYDCLLHDGQRHQQGLSHS